MTFNSYGFLFVFLPLVLAGYYLLTRVFRSQNPALVWLVLASFVFYGYLGPGYVVVLAGSVLMNFLVTGWMLRQPAESRGRSVALITGILANLLLLGLYKYTGFIAENVNALFGTSYTALVQNYPVGLSFYTFIQIGFLLDAYVGQVERVPFLRYVLFGTFFPYLTAGPIVRSNEILQQLDVPVRERTGTVQVVVGLTMFAMGLFKKMVLADNVAPYAGTLFGAASSHAAFGAGDAWTGAVAYTLQLYFDFSGYSDMAIGLGYMLGLRLPLNFDSPLQATSMMDFWRRWHMTMTRFFTNYVYTPMAMQMMRRSAGGPAFAPKRLLAVVCLPIVVTFLLVGLWHGAGWGFIVWGLVQGVGMAINLTWRELQVARRLPHVPAPVGWLLTMVLLVVSLVFFRAPTLGDAFTVLQAMIGLGPAGAPGPAQFFGSTTLFGVLPIVPALVWVALLGAVALFFPENTQQILKNFDVALPTLPSPERKPWARLTWRPTWQWAIPISVMAGLALLFVGGPSPFLYYKF